MLRYQRYLLHIGPPFQKFATAHPTPEIISNRHAIAFAKGQQFLFAKLKAPDLWSLPIRDCTKCYLTVQLQSKSYLGTFAQVLSTATAQWDTDLGLMRIVELGGGTGLETILAIKSGIGHVTHCDIYDVSPRDVLEVARAVGLEIPAIICADTGDLVAELNADPSGIDVIVS